MGGRWCPVWYQVAQEAAARLHGHGACCGLARFLLSPYPEGSGQDAVAVVSTETCVRSEVPPGPPPGVWAESGHPWRGLWAQVTGRLTVKLVGEGRRGLGTALAQGAVPFYYWSWHPGPLPVTRVAVDAAQFQSI